MRHTKLDGLMTPVERIARVAASAYDAATAPQTAPSGSISIDNADGTHTIIGPQAGSGEGVPSGQSIAPHVGDTTPPPVPAGIKAWSGDGSLHVSWDGTLSGDVPADFDHISILVDGKEVAQLSSAGSVTAGGVKAGSTVSVTATAEDDACLADGTPAHNVSAPCAAIRVTIRDMMAEIKADADAHEGQIGAIQKDIADFKKNATATYATKTEVDSKTGAITKTLSAEYTKTADLAGTSAVKAVQAAADRAKSAASAAQSSADSAATAASKAQGTADKAATAASKAQGTADKAATAASKAQGTADKAAGDLSAYKGTVSETYAEKTELKQQVNLLKSTMTSNYTAFTDYRTSNDTALSKAQSDATNAQSTIDSYKSSNDRAVADAKAAGTTAQNQLSSYKSSNDAKVAAAKKAGTDAQANLDSYRGTTDQRLDELKNIADNAIETWYLKGAPTASNPPASSWTTDALRKKHAGDLYMDTDTGYSYRWSGTAWVRVKDSDVTKALKEIETVKTTYATKSELTATDKELSGKVSDSLTTAKTYTDRTVSAEVTNRNAAITVKANEISQQVSKTYTKTETFNAYQSDADGRIATANSNASTAKSTAQTAASDAAKAKTSASTAVDTANAAKTTAQTASTSASNALSAANGASTTANAAKNAAASATSTANAAKSAADTAKSTADAVDRAAVKSYPFPSSLNASSWVHIGDWSNTHDSHTLKIELLSGDGYNANTSQNSTVSIFVKDGYQSTASAANAYAATVKLGHLDRSKCHVDVIASSASSCSIWIKLDFQYGAGSYTVAMTPGDTWTHSGAVSATEPTGAKQDVAFLVNAEEANAAAGNAQKAADKAKSDLAAYKTQVTQTYSTKSELKSTSDSITAKVDSNYTRATSYADGKVAQEVADRNAAIKAQADSITLGVSKTYTKYETFNAYQEDADGRIAAANSNASTAVSTANAASSTANAASSTANAAKTTANGAASTASSAKSVADSASSAAKAASTSASNAVSAANTAKTTAQTAKSTADTAKSTADSAKSAAGNAQTTANKAVTNAAKAQGTADAAKAGAASAQSKADDAWARTLRVEVMSAPKDAAGDTSLLTANVFRGGELLSDEAVAKMGMLSWYVGGKRVATGSTYTCAAGTAAECRLEA